MRVLIASLLALLSLPAAALPPGAVELRGGRSGEEVLRSFVDSDPDLRARLADVAARAEALRPSDLRDALSETPPAAPPGAEVSAEQRTAFLQSLPGMRALPGSPCKTLSDCSSPEFAIDVQEPRWLPDALRRLLHPWMLLQRTRRSSLEIAAAEAADAVMTVRLKGFKGIDAPAMSVQVTPKPLGGFEVGFAKPEDAAGLYSRARAAALR